MKVSYIDEFPSLILEIWCIVVHKVFGTHRLTHSLTHGTDRPEYSILPAPFFNGRAGIKTLSELRRPNDKYFFIPFTQLKSAQPTVKFSCTITTHVAQVL